ncbi:MAG: putative peptidoglycan glycosyltransferase FtsW [bacterium]|nr:putative peptidoglycan glycosyltransferase FtsW [bacterium]
MADQPAVPPSVPQFTDADFDLPRVPRTPIIKGGTRARAETVERPERKVGILGQIDRPLLVMLVLLLAIGTMMIYSATFDWSYQVYDSATFVFFQHVRSLVIGLIVFVAAMAIDYRLIRRFAVLLLATIGGLIAVLLFGDGTFGARRAFFQGSYQPGEVAELTMVIYMAAWLGSKKTKVASFAFGFLPFMILIGIIVGLVVLQPDLSTAVTIIVVCTALYFLAGANISHLITVAALGGGAGIIFSQRLEYAQDRVDSFVASITDLTQTNYHALQAIIAFREGGWFGKGLGLGEQKFGSLPAPHTDSIFAVIGEELGVLGAGLVVLLFVILIMRGLQIARRAPDTFGSLLAAGITLWIATKALLNVATMLSLVPSTGVALPFISFGGSSLVVALAGAGLLLSISRVTARVNTPEGRGVSANYDRGWGNRWSRLSGPGGR